MITAAGILSAFAATITAFAAEAPSPRPESPGAVVTAAVSRALAVLSAPEPATPSGNTNRSAGRDAWRAERRAQLRLALEDLVDFREMSRRTLGRHWSTLTAEQQAEFVDLFTRLLEQSYLARADGRVGQTVQVISETVRGDTAVVRWSLTGPAGPDAGAEYGRPQAPIELTCSLHRASDRWRIYDVGVNEFGVVSIYRTQFARILQAEPYSALAGKLRQKVEGAAAAVPAR